MIWIVIKNTGPKIVQLLICAKYARMTGVQKTHTSVCNFYIELWYCKVLLPNSFWGHVFFFFAELSPTRPVPCSASRQRYTSLLDNAIIPALQLRYCFRTIVFMQDGMVPQLALQIL